MSEKYGRDKAKVLVTDWWDLFEFPVNQPFKEMLIEMVHKYPERVVMEANKNIIKQLRHKYLPRLGMIQEMLDDEYGSVKREEATQDLLTSLATNDNKEDSNQRIYFHMIVNNLRDMSQGKISKVEYLQKQADWFKYKGMDEDAKYLNNYIENLKSGVKNETLEEYNDE